MAFKVWFETEERYVFGEGAFDLLERVSQLGSLSKAADSANMSYRYAWGLVNKIEESIDAPVLETRRGGEHGGGGSELTRKGKLLLRSYLRIKEDFEELSDKHSRHLESNLS